MWAVFISREFCVMKCNLSKWELESIKSQRIHYRNSVGGFVSRTESRCLWFLSNFFLVLLFIQFDWAIEADVDMGTWYLLVLIPVCGKTKSILTQGRQCGEDVGLRSYQLVPLPLASCVPFALNLRFPVCKMRVLFPVVMGMWEARYVKLLTHQR